jgi:two-component system NarL family sensor kinase
MVASMTASSCLSHTSDAQKTDENAILRSDDRPRDGRARRRTDYAAEDRSLEVEAMERLNGTGKKPSSAEAVAALRAVGVVVVGVAVLIGRPTHGTGFIVTLAVACVYAIALGVLAARGRRGLPPAAISLADVAFILVLIAFSGGALSEARLALVIYPVAMGLAHSARAIALVTAFAAAGFAAVSASSLGPGAADTAFAETLVALLVVGAIGAALAGAVQRRTRQVQELGADRAALLSEALDAEERERARIGERLHDDTLQSLLAAQQDVREARAGYLQSLEYADEALTDAVRALRETVLGLHPASLADRGLGVALQVELDRAARRTRLDVDLHVDPEALGPHDALVYTAARELITNAVKHASATRLEVRLERTADALVLTVADDGLGMPAERADEARAAGHVGLASTRRGEGRSGPSAGAAGNGAARRSRGGVLRAARAAGRQAPRRPGRAHLARRRRP